MHHCIFIAKPYNPTVFSVAIKKCDEKVKTEINARSVIAN